MRRKLNPIPALLCVFALLAAQFSPVAVLAKEKAETAEKTVNISIEKSEGGEPDAKTAEDDAEKDAGKEAENKVKNEDGESEKSSNYSIVRPEPSEMTEIRISNYDEWCDFVQKCTYDTWSADKYVVLTNNIDCAMNRFTPVPYFAGVFEGNGFAIGKAAFTDEQNYVGVFSKTAPSAVIRNLNVIGVMKPEGKPFHIGGIVGNNAGMIANCKFDGYVEGYDYIGGIAGYNEATGIISACSATGKITGLHYVGGICGANSGLVTGCSTAADINTVTKDVETDIQDIKVEEMFTSLLNIGKEEGNKKTIASSTSPVDIGGIVGHNIGEISSCSNDSLVGYEHVGYNVGGITGRSAGYVHDCINNGKLNGRKDVGGIVGQAEPYIRLDLSKDIIAQLNTAINTLHDSVEKTIKDTNASSGVVSARLNVIKSFADNALSDTGYLADSTIDFVNGATAATNEIVGRIEYVVDETSANDGPMDDVESAGKHLRDTAEDVEKVAEDLNLYGYLKPDEREAYDNAKKDIKEATDEFNRVEDIYETGDDAAVDAIKAGRAAERTLERNTAEAAGRAAAKEKFTEDKFNEKYPEGKQPGNKKWSDLTDAEKDEFYNNELTDEERADITTRADAAGVEAGNAAVKEWAVDKAAEDTDYADKMVDNTAIIGGLVLEYSDVMSKNVKNDGKNAGKDLEKMATDLKDAGKGMKNIIKSVADKSAVRFPQLSDEYKMRTNSLVANIQGMSDNLGYLNNEMKGSTDVVCADLENVNDDFSSIMLLFTDAMDGVLDMDYSELYEDESDNVCETSVDATIANCTNGGSIYGDINTGGIAGTMAEEYDFDLEGDVTGIKDSAKNSTYRTKCVARQNVNRGSVKGKKSYAGGVCGLHEIGTILRCSNFGKAASESGDYVGGVAGRSYATITNSYEKGVLSGESYIGGIAGSGATITNCVAMPNIIQGTTFLGAIIGSDDDGAKLKGNVFVSDTLAGADRISRAGQAEPITYQQLLALENIPADYSIVRVDFIVDDKVVSSEKKTYGAYVTPDETPLENVIAKKDDGSKKDKENKDDTKVVLAADEYIDWDCDKNIPVFEDTQILGEIVRYRSSLASEQVRANKQSVFLVDGKFKQEDVLQVSPISGAGKGIEDYLLSIPDDGEAVHTIRYQAPPDLENITISVGGNGAYEEVTCGTYGNYITFEAAGNTVAVRIEKEQRTHWLRWVVLGVGCIIAILVIVNVTVKIVRWRKNKRNNSENKDNNTDKKSKNTEKKKQKNKTEKEK